MGLWDIEKIPYVGREKGPQEGLAFHYYDADKVVAGKKMKVAAFRRRLVAHVRSGAGRSVRHRHRPASVVRQVLQC